MATLLSWVLGAVLTVVGVAGFVTGSPLLIFEVDPLHNTIHLVSGLIGLYAASKGEALSSKFLVIFGLIYAAVTLLGFLMDGDIVGLMHVNQADNYLHLAIAVVALLVGFSSKKKSSF